MKKFLLLAACGLGLCQSTAWAQEFRRNCGAQDLKNALMAQDPSFKQHLDQSLAEQKQISAQYENENINNPRAKTTGVPVIPVVFHVVLDSAQFNQIGGNAGILDRLVSQINVLNRDFNRQNSDSTQIPTVFKPVYGNVQIQFAPAHTKPDGTGTNGYEVKLTNTSFSGGINSAYSNAKHAATGGLDAWNPDTYLNVWVINTGSGSSITLGVTVPPSFTVAGGGPMANNEKGIVIHYGAYGSRTSPTQYFISGITGGRTLTHETGHYFEIWHTWGDDNGLCPNNGGQDDGIADTPPQADATYGAPSFPLYDSCSKPAVSNGIMFMNYMDYVNDGSMHMFTKGQIAVMQSKVNGESVSLTQHPDVLNWPLAVSNVEQNNNFDIYPNPTTGAVNISFQGNSGANSLKNISVMDMMGKNIKSATISNVQNGIYSIDLSGLSKGVYFVQCQFEEGMISRKIVLQ